VQRTGWCNGKTPSSVPCTSALSQVTALQKAESVCRQMQGRFSVIDSPAADRDVREKKKKKNRTIFLSGGVAGWFGGFHLRLITDPAFGPLGSDPVLTFTRKSSSNFPRCCKTWNWHHALMWYFVASSLLQVLVAGSV